MITALAWRLFLYTCIPSCPNAVTHATALNTVQGDMEGDKIIVVSAGEYSSAAASAKMMYGWGSNDYLCAGVGRNNPAQVGREGIRGCIASLVGKKGVSPSLPQHIFFPRLRSTSALVLYLFRPPAIRLNSAAPEEGPRPWGRAVARPRARPRGWRRLGGAGAGGRLPARAGHRQEQGGQVGEHHHRQVGSDGLGGPGMGEEREQLGAAALREAGCMCKGGKRACASGCTVGWEAGGNRSSMPGIPYRIPGMCRAGCVTGLSCLLIAMSMLLQGPG